MGLPVLTHEKFTPKIIKSPKGELILDFGQNFAGIVEMWVPDGFSGSRITLTHTEALDKQGNFTQSNIALQQKLPIQQDHYIHNGKSRKHIPFCSIMGFQYVKIEGYPIELKPEYFTGIAMYSELKQTGTFESSHPLLNQFVKNTQWSQKGNFLDIPTDCPTRERSGWAGDAQLFCYTGCLLTDLSAFMSKWIQDVAAAQEPDGMIHNISPKEGPTILKALEGSAGWGDAAVIIPWTLWKFYGDRRILQIQYDSMKKWVAYEIKNAKNKHWRRQMNPKYWFEPYKSIKPYVWDTKYHWGEWLAADSDGKSNFLMSMCLVWRIIFSEPEVATAYFANSCRLMAEIATELGKDTDANYYADLAQKITHAYQVAFLPRSKQAGAPQARYVRPIALHLAPDADKTQIVQLLNEHLQSNGYHVGTGFLSTPFLLEILSDAGYLETAYKTLLQTTAPSWLYAVSSGANTIWESWYGKTPDGTMRLSLNHYSYGAGVGWLFKVMAGIKWDLQSPGYKHFYLAPHPGGGLQFAHASFDSPYGLISSRWTLNQANKYDFEFTVPTNTTATVVLPISAGDRVLFQNRPLEQAPNFNNILTKPNSIEFRIGSGTYIFQTQ